MIRNDICCDVCGNVVAEIEPGLFRRKSTVRKYLICKGISYYGKKPLKSHICFDCVYEIRDTIAKKEQDK